MSKQLISASNDWLLHQQGLALSALFPTTPEAWQYFFVKIHEGMNYKVFAQDWNQSANGKDCFYVITEVLSPIVKTQENVTNICASQEMNQDKIDLIE